MSNLGYSVNQHHQGEFARALSEEYQRYADMLEYVQHRCQYYEEGIGPDNPTWWADLRIECEAKRDAIYTAIRMARTHLGLRIYTREGNVIRGRSIFKQNFD